MEISIDNFYLQCNAIAKRMANMTDNTDLFCHRFKIDLSLMIIIWVNGALNLFGCSGLVFHVKLVGTVCLKYQAVTVKFLIDK